MSSIRNAAPTIISSKQISAAATTPFERQLLVALTQSAAGDPGTPVLEEVALGAKAFMKKNGLFGANPEGQIDAHTRAKWLGFKTMNVEGKQFVVMTRVLETKYDGDTQWKGAVPGDLFNVVAVSRNAAGTLVFDRFEDAVAVPKQLTVAFGSNYSNSDRKDQYFGVLEGKDVVEALKSIYGATRVSGATIQVEKGPKAAFDPTPGRRWRTTSVHYALDRGSSAEVLDGKPSQLDEDFDGYSHSTKGHFAPWEYGQIRHLLVGGKWRIALPLSALPRP